MQVDPFHVEADTIDYHTDRELQRVEAARRLIHISDVLSKLDDLIASEPSAERHPCHDLAAVLLDRQTACDGGKLFDDLKRLILQAIDSLTDDALEAMED
jgi:hypothetical protein